MEAATLVTRAVAMASDLSEAESAGVSDPGALVGRRD